jgi:surfeit locus 1 family protein
MRRLPWLATAIVAAAVLVMIGLGLWQLARASEKERLLARYAANGGKPELVIRGPADFSAELFRRARVTCAPSRGTRVEGAGRFGFRVTAPCLLAEGEPSLLVQLGTSRRPDAAPAFAGGTMRGWLASAPDGRSLLRRAFDPRPAPVMIVADPPLAGLAPSPAPSLAEVPNNHRSYAFQWFAFASLALLIYGLALRRRGKGQT